MTERPFATSLRELARESGIPERELTTLLKTDPAAPQKTDAGYDILEVIEWYGGREPAAAESAEQTVPMTVAPVPAAPVRWITITIPVAEPEGYLQQPRPLTPRHIDCHIRDRAEVHAVNSFLQGCIHSHQQMPSGEHVDRLGHAIRWLARQIHEQLPRAAEAA